MRISMVVALGLGLVAAGAAVSCGGGGDGTGSSGDGGDETSPGSGTGGSGGTGVCASSDFEDLVISICKTQHPPAPQPGELGAPCSSDAQCDSSYCLEPFGSAAYCSALCPAGNECPLGFDCQDTGTGDGSACYQGVCLYGGSDATDCTKNLLGEMDTACHSECSIGRIEGWIDCLAGAGRLCGPEDAAEKCGVERGLLEDCCIGCDGFEW